MNGPSAPNRYTAMKMPRKDYKKHFARDKDGKYIGTEPEREWSEEDLQREFGQYQDMALRSIPGHNEFGEGGTSMDDWVHERDLAQKAMFA